MFKTRRGRQAVWCDVEDKGLRYVGMFGQKEVSVHNKDNKIVELYLLPGGLPEDENHFEKVVRSHIEGQSVMSPVWKRL